MYVLGLSYAALISPVLTAHVQLATHYRPVCFVGPTTYKTTMQLHLVRLLNEHRKSYQNGGQTTWVDMIFINKDVFSFLFAYMLYFLLQIATIVVSLKIIFLIWIGDDIQVIIYDDELRTYKDRLQEGKVYLVRNLRLSPQIRTVSINLLLIATDYSLLEQLKFLRS